MKPLGVFSNHQCNQFDNHLLNFENEQFNMKFTVILINIFYLISKIQISNLNIFSCMFSLLKHKIFWLFRIKHNLIRETKQYVSLIPRIYITSYIT